MFSFFVVVLKKHTTFGVVKYRSCSRSKKSGARATIMLFFLKSEEKIGRGGNDLIKYFWDSKKETFVGEYFG